MGPSHRNVFVPLKFVIGEWRPGPSPYIWVLAVPAEISTEVALERATAYVGAIRQSDGDEQLPSQVSWDALCTVEMR
jgi:hypothetical protein